jgi:exopolysaccharide production protein ExoZ
MRLGNLEILRAVAALAVVFFHTCGGLLSRGFDIGFLRGIYQQGALGVDVFFVISGFVIFRGILEAPRSPWAFAKSRLKRILPSYWILTIAAAIVTLSAASFEMQGTLRVPDLAWLLQSLSFVSVIFNEGSPVLYQGWSLEYEMLFYVLVTFALFTRKPLLSGFLPGAALTFAVLALGWNSRILEFVAGLLIAYLSKRRGLSLASAWALTLGGLALLVVQASESQLGAMQNGLGATLLVWGISQLPQKSNRLIEKVGSASYPVYLIQWFTIPAVLVIALKFPKDLPFALVLIGISLALTQATGMIFDRYVDQPIRKRLTTKAR